MLPVLIATATKCVSLHYYAKLLCSSSNQLLLLLTSTARSQDAAQVSSNASTVGCFELLQGVLVFHYVTISRHLYSFGLLEVLSRKTGQGVTLIHKGPRRVDPQFNHIRFMEINPFSLSNVAFQFSFTHEQLHTYNIAAVRELSPKKNQLSSAQLLAVHGDDPAVSRRQMLFHPSHTTD